jgi:hypothetical protein
MSDTIVYTRKDGSQFRLTGAFKAAMIYVAIDACLSGLNSLAQFLYGLKEADWTSLWGPQKFGLVMLQISSILGSALLMFKGASSKSTRSANEPTEPNPTI